MKEITFSGTPEEKEEKWLQWREYGIGSSDIPIIMGASPFKSNIQLWKEKCGFCLPMSGSNIQGIKHGKYFEPIVRERINKTQHLHLLPLNIEDGDHSMLKASLDGYDKEKKVLCEIKCPLSEDKIYKIKNFKTLPTDWEMQIQWQMMLINPIRAFAAVFDEKNDEIINIEIFPDKELQIEMRKEALLFWEDVTLGRQPSKKKEAYTEIENEEAKQTVKEYKELNLQIQNLQKILKEKKDFLISFGNEKNFICNDLIFTFCKPRISYDYKHMEEDGIDLSKYSVRGKKGYYRITN